MIHRLLALILLLFSGKAVAQDPFAILAVVNDIPITQFEVRYRLDLAEALGGGGSILEADMLDQLVTEAIHISEAQSRGVMPGDDALEDSYANIAAGNGLTPAQFDDVLAEESINPSAFRSRLKAQLAFQALVSASSGGALQVSDEEFAAEWEVIQQERGQHEWQLTEVYVPGNVRGQANQIAARMRSSAGDFATIARAASFSPTAAEGGDLGWVRQSELPQAHFNAIHGLEAGDVSNPVAGDGGFYVYGVRQARPVGAAFTVKLYNLRRLFISLEAQGQSEDDVRKLTTLQNVLGRVDSCERFSQASAIYGEPGSGDLGSVELGNLPPQLANIIAGLEVDEFSALVPDQGGASIFINCGTTQRSEPLTEGMVRAALRADKAREFTRELNQVLRRRAYIEYP